MYAVLVVSSKMEPTAAMWACKDTGLVACPRTSMVHASLITLGSGMRLAQTRDAHQRTAPAATAVEAALTKVTRATGRVATARIGVRSLALLAVPKTLSKITACSSDRKS